MDTASTVSAAAREEAVSLACADGYPLAATLLREAADWLQATC